MVSDFSPDDIPTKQADAISTAPEAPATLVPSLEAEPAKVVGRRSYWIAMAIAVLVIIVVGVGIGWYFLVVSPTSDHRIHIARTASSSALPKQATLLKPLSLTTVKPQLVIEQQGKPYLVDVDGSHEGPGTMFAEGGRTGLSRRCAYYVKNNNLYRAAIDGSQLSQITNFDDQLFAMKQPIGEGAGPGYGVTVLGVDTNCRQAIVSVNINAATEDMPISGVYYVAPEQNLQITLINSDDKVFNRFVGDKPVFLSNAESKLYSMNAKGIFSILYPTAIPLFPFADFIHVSSSGVLVYGAVSTGDSDRYDPATGQKVTESSSQVMEIDLASGESKAITPKATFTTYQQVSVSPDFNYVFYARQTGEVVNDQYLEQYYLYNRSTGAAKMVNTATGNGRVGAWLDATTYLLESNVAVSSDHFRHDLLKCTATSLSCTPFRTDTSVHAASSF